MKLQDAFVGQSVGFMHRDIVYTGWIKDIYKSKNNVTNVDRDIAYVETPFTYYHVPVKKLLGVLGDLSG